MEDSEGKYRLLDRANSFGEKGGYGKILEFWDSVVKLSVVMDTLSQWNVAQFRVMCLYSL